MAIPWPTTGAAIAKSLKWGEDRYEELEDYALVAVSKIEEKVGPWHGQALTHTVAMRREVTRLVLPWPVDLVTGVVLDGNAVEYDAVDLGAGVVYGTFPAGVYTITATARAAASCPPDVALAARKLGAHLAKQDLVGPRQSGYTGGPDKDLDVQQGFALPRAVSELIADYVRPGGFA
ncbi:hypothetical protein [Microbacterium sp.]|uniref:hypothetical protein n=1 Tax=Microbacterium sp. TaxID=51671 RepID=UPI0028116E42|nr:hypothetical protein [Microbacterium sp.]